MGRLMGTLGSGFLYSYVGENMGSHAGNDATAGLAACMFAGTASSLLAAAITLKIDDDEAGLRCGSLICVQGSGIASEEEEEEEEEEERETAINEKEETEKNTI